MKDIAFLASGISYANCLKRSKEPHATCSRAPRSTNPVSLAEVEHPVPADETKEVVNVSESLT